MTRPHGLIETGLTENDMTSKLAALTLLAALLASSQASAQQGNADAGEDVFKKCRACHDVGEGAKNKVGPQLNGIIGRKSGTVDGFAYSEANKDAGAKGLIWTDAEMFKYLENPQAFMPKNKMAFAGLKDEQDRRDVIAYLAKFK
jgi:cytochrome c2